MTAWVGADGVIHATDGTIIDAVADAVVAHVRAAIIACRDISDLSASGAITSMADVDVAPRPAAFWLRQVSNEFRRSASLPRLGLQGAAEPQHSR